MLDIAIHQPSPLVIIDPHQPQHGAPLRQIEGTGDGAARRRGDDLEAGPTLAYAIALQIELGERARQRRAGDIGKAAGQQMVADVEHRAAIDETQAADLIQRVKRISPIQRHSSLLASSLPWASTGFRRCAAARRSTDESGCGWRDRR